jgi:hypothetical protein
MAKRKAKAKDWAFVEVHWKDAASLAEWQGIGGAPKLAEVIHRGWLFSEDGDSVSLCAGIVLGKTGVIDVGDSITIPRGCIVSIREIDV